MQTINLNEVVWAIKNRNHKMKYGKRTFRAVAWTFGHYYA